MRIKIKKIANGQTILGGAIEGRRHLAAMNECLCREPREPTVTFADYSDIVVATASYLRETIVTLNSILRERRSNYYIVIANANETILEDLEVVAKASNSAFICCLINADEHASDIRIIGLLDPKQQITFDLVRDRRETDARELMQACADHEHVQQTAWNNRLAALAGLRLVIEISHGRSKRYRIVLE